MSIHRPLALGVVLGSSSIVAADTRALELGTSSESSEDTNKCKICWFKPKNERKACKEERKACKEKRKARRGRGDVAPAASVAADVDHQKANLNNLDLRGSIFKNIDLSEADLQEANLEEAKFEDVDLSEAKFQGANLKKAEFKDVDLTNTNFQDASLEGATFQSTNLDNARMGDVSGGAGLSFVLDHFTFGVGWAYSWGVDNEIGRSTAYGSMLVLTSSEAWVGGLPVLGLSLHVPKIPRFRHIQEAQRGSKAKTYLKTLIPGLFLGLSLRDVRNHVLVGTKIELVRGLGLIMGADIYRRHHLVDGYSPGQVAPQGALPVESRWGHGAFFLGFKFDHLPFVDLSEAIDRKIPQPDD